MIFFTVAYSSIIYYPQLAQELFREFFARAGFGIGVLSKAMTIDFRHSHKVNVHVDPDVLRVLGAIAHLFAHLETKINSIMATLADIQAQNTELIAAVADENTVIDSAITLINGFAATLQALKDQLAAALAGQDPAAAQAVVDSMTNTVATIKAEKDKAAAAVAANTPAA